MGRWISIAALVAMATACVGHGRKGSSLDPDPMVESLRIESLYMHRGVKLIAEGLPTRGVSLKLYGRINSAMKGMLILDPNQCSLDVFGDRLLCTRIASRGIEVELRRLTLTDSAGLMRKYFEITGEGLTGDVALIVQGSLLPGELERCYLVVGSVLVPLYLEDGS
ncbi:hypothetical protein [Paraliomyxa miuraensis]|uniref:hypothetical protein n=1 Tax=Paraliomyxa miuraensis TaxID=376150 RepID=UPI002258B357|nr:hypothetical protein [Paraliomyxa miuraensis]MCX4240487.1 hypothetical protein [Paraliomyxa miuraensis]